MCAQQRAKDNVAAIISAGYGGQVGGQGIADVITGRYNPGSTPARLSCSAPCTLSLCVLTHAGGALSYTWHTEHFAKLTPYDSMEMRPNGTNGSPGRTHRYLDVEACPDCLSWPFGYGLSVSICALRAVSQLSQLNLCNAWLLVSLAVHYLFRKTLARSDSTC